MTIEAGKRLRKTFWSCDHLAWKIPLYNYHCPILGSFDTTFFHWYVTSSMRFYTYISVESFAHARRSARGPAGGPGTNPNGLAKGFRVADMGEDDWAGGVGVVVDVDLAGPVGADFLGTVACWSFCVLGVLGGLG